VENINGLYVGKRYFFEEMNASGVFHSFNGLEFVFEKVLPKNFISKRFLCFTYNPLKELNVKIIDNG